VPLVCHLIGAAMEAVKLYDSQIKYRINIYENRGSNSEGEDFEQLVDLITEDDKIWNC